MRSMFTACCISFILMFSLSPLWSEAQEPSAAGGPVEVGMTIDRTSCNPKESVQSILAINNTTPYTITNITVLFQGGAFTAKTLAGLPKVLLPHASAYGKYELTGWSPGEHQAMFVLQYSWHDPKTVWIHSRVETGSVGSIEVTPAFSFDWPTYLIPLLAGFVISQLGVWFADRRKRLEEDRKQEEQARGVAIALLQAARKGIERREKASFRLWEEAVVKGNLYPALHRLGRKIGKPELSKELAEASVSLADYNSRIQESNLPDDLPPRLISDLTALIVTIENSDQRERATNAQESR